MAGSRLQSKVAGGTMQSTAPGKSTLPSSAQPAGRAVAARTAAAVPRLGVTARAASVTVSPPSAGALNPRASTAYTASAYISAVALVVAWL